jgi:hypothetical protein
MKKEMKKWRARQGTAEETRWPAHPIRHYLDILFLILKGKRNKRERKKEKKNKNGKAVGGGLQLLPLPLYYDCTNNNATTTHQLRTSF